MLLCKLGFHRAAFLPTGRRTSYIGCKDCNKYIGVSGLLDAIHSDEPFYKRIVNHVRYKLLLLKIRLGRTE